jgi:wobble nucleotide-excising tRNase
MVLRKIISLKNVGRFRCLTARDDVAFRKLTLIYGPNGHGKTTLTGVLRSLATGDGAYVDERHTLGVAPTDFPTADILLESGRTRYSNGAWSTTAPELEIFDSTFVNDNVFTGEYVGPEHRKNLYEVVVGSAAVALARVIDSIDAEARRTAAENGVNEDSLAALIQRPFPLEDFLDLAPVPELTEKIRDRTTRLSAVLKQREILARKQLEVLAAPAFPDIAQVLSKSVAQISKDTEERVRRHLQHLDHRGEAWIRQGFGYTKKAHLCPYCGQDTSTVDLVKLYAEFFSSTYREHVVEIERGLNLRDQTLGDSALGAVQKRVLENDARIEGWADLADLRAASFNTDRLEQAWKHVRSVVRDRLRRKAGNPSDAVPEDDELVAAIKDYDEAEKPSSRTTQRSRRPMTTSAI